MAKLPNKVLILHKAIELFADYGYANVSMNAIAEAVGIKAASIYNHYESKEAILEQIYDYYDRTCHAGRVDEATYMPILRNGTAQEILDIVNYPLAEPVMLNYAVVRIIWSRSYIDERAKKLYQKHILGEDLEYLLKFLRQGREIGRIDMTDWEIENFAIAYLGFRAHMASVSVIDPGQVRWRNVELEVTRYMSQLIRVGPGLDA